MKVPKNLTEEERKVFIMNTILYGRYCFGDWNCLTDGWRWSNIANGKDEWEKCPYRDACRAEHHRRDK